MSKHSPSKEQWALVHNLFDQLLDSSNPEQLIQSLDDELIRRTLAALWRRHQEAEVENFLAEQITIVKDLTTANSKFTFHQGQILADRFLILRVLGSGGMGEVYLADDKRLSETVALKTVKYELGRFRENRVRFLDEVRRARQVTHPNVCRIFDVFEHDGVSFYSMEYLAGATLAEALLGGPIKPERARQISFQTAEGLWTAHKNGVLHCDFKPGNIILTSSGKSERSVITDFGLALALPGAAAASNTHEQAGTPFYMAPELLTGKPPSIRSDIYAFGKVLNQLSPGHRLAPRCTAEQAANRPESMEWVLKELRGATNRRTWLTMSAAVAFAGIGALYVKEHTQPKIALGSRQRLRINGFASSDMLDAKTIRTLLIMALRQSPLLSVVGDRGYLTASGSSVAKAGFALPLADLLATAGTEKARLALDGRIEKEGNGLRLAIAIYDVERAEEAYRTEVVVVDKRQTLHLAELAAAKLREEAFGEAAFHGAYRPLDQITSSAPAAVDLYFRAIYQYELGSARSALTLLDQALTVDPDFVLAYHYKALSLSAINLMESAQLQAQKAFDMRARLTERERNWVESVFLNTICDWAGQAEALRKNIVLFPDEAIFERQTAFALARLGMYDDAISHNKRSVALDPFGENNTSELLLNLAEANRIDDFLAVENQWEASGRRPDHFNLGIASLQQGKYSEAANQFRQMGEGNSQWQSLSRLTGVIPLIISGRFNDAIAGLAGDLAWDETKPPAERDETRTYMRKSWLGELYRLKDRPSLAAEQADFLLHLMPLACNLTALREAVLLAFELKEIKLVEKGFDLLSTVAARWPSAHSLGAAWLTRGLLFELQGDTASGDLREKAKGAWADPLNLLAIAGMEGRAGLLDAQLASLKTLERLRGKIFRLHFAGLAVLGWIEQARCLERLSLFEEALRLYDRVAEHWGVPQTAGTLMRQVSQERNELRRRFA